jgi:hypothetical protein
MKVEIDVDPETIDRLSLRNAQAEFTVKVSGFTCSACGYHTRFPLPVAPMVADVPCYNCRSLQRIEFVARESELC